MAFARVRAIKYWLVMASAASTGSSIYSRHSCLLGPYMQMPSPLASPLPYFISLGQDKGLVGVTAQPLPEGPKAALCNAFGFGGTNASLLLATPCEMV
eukprot:989686-Pelagomonas_calceolata.AAC.7